MDLEMVLNNFYFCFSFISGSTYMGLYIIRKFDFWNGKNSFITSHKAVRLVTRDGVKRYANIIQRLKRK